MVLFLQVNPWMYNGKGDATPLPHKVFLSCFPRGLKTAPEVFSSCSVIPRALFETSLVMVSCCGTRYDDISSRCPSQFGVKIHVFFNFFQQ